MVKSKVSDNFNEQSALGFGPKDEQKKEMF